jgi:hypothetical protein
MADSYWEKKGNWLYLPKVEIRMENRFNKKMIIYLADLCLDLPV